MSDSALISQLLVDESWVSDLNEKLSPSKAAQDLALRALLEDKLYFYLVRDTRLRFLIHQRCIPPAAEILLVNAV